MAANGTVLLLGTVSGMLAARLLGPSGRGELAIVTLWPIALAMLGNLGINQAVAFFTAQQPERRNAVFTASLVIAAVQGAILMGLGYLLLPYFLREHAPDVVHWARWFLLFIPLVFLSGYPLNLLQGSMNLDAYNLSRVFTAAWYALVLVALFWLRRPDLGTIVIWQLA
ncbi:MAG TPA: oligosaccharide flippase family protein, partial [Gemmatimonadales bacterium]|nr:oligosaccharide flippase family protein [Gemmatimonadales bacterium]